MDSKADRTCAFPCPSCGELMYIPVEFRGATFGCDKCGAQAEMKPEWVAQLQAFDALSSGAVF